MTRTTDVTAHWTTIPTDALTATNTVPAADAEMTESVTTLGIIEPLYVATTEAGTLRVVDGMRRLAAAVAAGLTEVPVTHRPLIRVDALTAHPDNARANLRVKELTASIRVEGVRTPIVVTRTEAGVLRVVDGHRRLAAAIDAGLLLVPYTYDVRDDASQLLDMVTTARYREALTKAEETAALFEAAAAGANVRRIATAGGTTQADAKKLIKLSGSKAARKATAAAVKGDGHALTLDAMAALAALEQDDPEAAQRITDAIEKRPAQDHAWAITRATTDLARRRKAEAHRVKLEKAGARIRVAAELGDKAVRLHTLREADGHEETCQGHVWTHTEGDDHYKPMCANWQFFGHELHAGAQKESETKITPAERRAIIEGGKDMDTAEEIRRTWVGEILGKTRHPKAVTDLFTQIIARELLAGGPVLTKRSSHPNTRRMLTEWVGASAGSDPAARVDQAPTRAAAQAFAAVAAAYEQHTVRTVWRTDGSHAGAQVRKDAARYLGWLVSLGYRPTAIEQAVIDGTAYNPAAQAVTAAEEDGATL